MYPATTAKVKLLPFEIGNALPVLTQASQVKSRPHGVGAQFDGLSWLSCLFATSLTWWQVGHLLFCPSTALSLLLPSWIETGNKAVELCVVHRSLGRSATKPRSHAAITVGSRFLSTPPPKE